MSHTPRVVRLPADDDREHDQWSKMGEENMGEMNIMWGRLGYFSQVHNQ